MKLTDKIEGAISRIPISRLIIFGTCKKCGGYLVNIIDDFSSSLGALNIACSVCGEPDLKVEERIIKDTKLYHKEKLGRCRGD